jgi:hypothetical protein
MGVLGILTMSGSLPLNELNVRSTGSADDLRRELQILRDGGLVAFEGELPAPSAIPTTVTPIRLTRAGLRSSLG